MLMALKDPIDLQRKLRGFGQLDLKSSDHLAPANLPSRVLRVYLHSKYFFFAGLGSNSSSLQLSTPDAPIWMCSSVILSAFGEEQSPFDISVSVHFTLEDVHQPLHV